MGQEKKLALITGAGRASGKVIALKLAKSGADIALTDLNPELEDLKSELNKLGSQCLDFQVDVTTPKQLIKWSARWLAVREGLIYWSTTQVSPRIT